MTRATGIGSWPGRSAREAVRASRDLLLADTLGGLGLPYLPETPARGPGADLVGRGLGLLVDLPVDLQPAGWRFVDRPGRDAGRTAALLSEDLDELAEAYDGYAGPLKVAVAGPWTLAASVELHRGERSVADPGACREIASSLAEGVRRLLAHVGRLVPGAELVLQVDEPSLPAVLRGDLPTASGYGRIRAVEASLAVTALGEVLGAHPGPTVVHCCDPLAPIPVLRQARPSALSLDLTAASPARWESVAATLEAGIDLYAGCLPTDGSSRPAPAAALVLDGLERAGVEAAWLERVTVTPTCGLAGLTTSAAATTLRHTGDVALELTERTPR